MGVAAKMRLGVLVSGRGSNLQSIIAASREPNYPVDVAVVISNVAGAQALARAEAAGIPALAIPHRDFSGRAAFEEKLAATLRQYGVEWVALAGFMRVLTPTFLAAFENRVINIHPALLPSFPGVDAPRQALERGVKIAGCTVHFVDSGTDTGPIIAQAAVEVLGDDTDERLAERILKEEHRLYPKVLQWIAEGRVILKNGRVEIAERQNPSSGGLLTGC